MRMRLKKFLQQRTEQASEYFLDNTCHPNAIQAAKNPNYIDFVSVFGNNNPVDLEIGCGKGKFATEYALLHPDRNIIAVERLTNVAVVGVEKAKSLNLPNVRFLVTNAEFLPCFVKNAGIQKIFLNFSCPFPKGTYKNRRLTHPKFLQIYQSLLTEGGCVVQKTDNQQFFDFGVESFEQLGWQIEEYSRDMYAGCPKDNIQTEYETKFVSQNKPIFRLVAKPPIKK